MRLNRRSGVRLPAAGALHERVARPVVGMARRFVHVEDGGTHASLPSNTAIHSSRVRVRNTAASAALRAGQPFRGALGQRAGVEI